MDLAKIKANIPPSDVIDDVAELFKVLGDQTRTKILFVLEGGELCVSDICECVDMTKYAVSHQLRILKASKLVKSRREGREIIYSLDDDHVSQIFDCAMVHVTEED